MQFFTGLRFEVQQVSHGLSAELFLCLEMIEAALLLLVVVYCRAPYLAQSSLSLTPKMSWNFSIAMFWVITSLFLPMTSNCTLVSSQWASWLSPLPLILHLWAARMVHIAQASTQCSKIELIWCGSRASLSQLKLEDRALEIGMTIIKPTDAVHDLRVLLDSELTIKQQVNRTISTCFYHLRRLR